jgi:hypothetical protein
MCISLFSNALSHYHLSGVCQKSSHGIVNAAHPPKNNTVPPCATKVLGKSMTLKPLLPLMQITDILQLPAIPMIR